MPEGDTVWLTARILHEALAGRRITGTDLRVPALATRDLSGRIAEEVLSRGKHLLVRLEGGLTLHSHLGMQGSWRVYRDGSAWRAGPQWQVRAVLRTERAAAVGYRLRILELLRTNAEAAALGQLGPDLLAAHWDASTTAEAVANLLTDPSRAIGPALLDQRNVAGIGNLYQAEVLFLTGVTPWTPAGTVPDLTRTVSLARELLWHNRNRWEQSTTGSLRRSDAHWVFERAGQPCRRCGSTVRRARDTSARQRGGKRPATEADRINYWCASCQQGAAPPS